jgi:hypothetical protein
MAQSDSASVQGLNKSSALASCEKDYFEMLAMPLSKRQAFAHCLYMAVQDLEPGERRRFLCGKRSQLRKCLWGCDSRSGAWEVERAGKVGVALKTLGLVDDAEGMWRDVETGRRVNTRLRELGRLLVGWDLASASTQDWLLQNWTVAMAMSLDELKFWIREHNPRARCALLAERGMADYGR